MVSLTFYGGIKEIGGNKILLEDKDTRVWFDFGESFNFGGDYFTGLLQPRGSVGLKDYFEFDLLPKIPGLYSEEDLKFTDLKYSEPEFDAVFISHPHFDHIQHIKFINNSIPIYLSKIGKIIVEAWEESRSVEFGEHDYHPFQPGKKIKVGSLEIIPISVDHSVPGACGFIVHTSEGTVVYTGDFRCHGIRRKETENFVELAAEEKPVAIICEGTRVVPKEERKYVGSEEDVRTESDRILKKANGLVVAAFYGRDVDRMATFAKVASDNNRQFVVSMRTALLLTKLDKEGLEVPKPSSDFLVYVRRKKSGEYDDKDYYKWERPFLNDAVNCEYINKHQSDLLLSLDFCYFTELVDIQPTRGGHFIHSMSEAKTEEDIEAEVMQNWLKHFGLEFHQVHSSGHCSKEEIRKIVENIKPETLFPIHTEHPEMFSGMAGKVHESIKLGKPYKI